MLVCPETKIPLRECSLEDATKLMCGNSTLAWRREGPRAVGPTARVLLRQDLECAYPILDGIPVLLLPEALFPESAGRSFNLKDVRWAEAYEEMEHYNARCAVDAAKLGAGISPPVPVDAVDHASTFPYPTHLWLDAPHDACGQLDCYLHLGSIRGKRVAQLGGKGLHAVKFLLAGAAEAWLITPMHGECLFAMALARRFGVEDRLRCVAAVAEQIPLRSASLDAIFSGGCFHHIDAEHAAPELRRVLVSGGKFCALDPWKTLLHAVGTRILGKREVEVHCRPMNSVRLQPLYRSFEHVAIKQHGPVLRYLTIGACKLLKKEMPIRIGFAIGQLEDQLFGRVPALRKRGGSVAILASKAESA